jgi:tetratricopeptide (TPR) repeat protein
MNHSRSSATTRTSRRTGLGRSTWIVGLALALAASGLALDGATAQETAPQPRLGEISFPTSGAAEARPHFLRGVLYLHSFEYEDAREAFRRARDIDPDFAMAYWGEAMTHNHPVWMQQDREAALAALDRLAPTAEGRLAAAGSEKERDWLRATHVLYGAGSKETRDDAYRDAMRRMHEVYPDDHEVASFYALSILGTAHEGRDFATYMRAAAVVEPVFDENPRHPGAVHYLIHSYDDPIHAPLGLRAARAYSEIAPAAAHAQHMTSHIFVALGMWREVIGANEVARDVQDARRAELGRPPNRCGHYAYWLQYGYLQKGRIDDARRLLDLCHEQFVASPASTSAGYFASMRARWLIDSGRWEEAGSWSAAFDGGASGDGVAAARDAHTDALAALRAGDRETASVHLERLESLRDAKSEASAEPAILALQVRARIALRDGASERAVELLREAADREAAMPFQFGPPAVAKPSHELLGDVLLELGREEAAADAYRSALDRAPRRTSSLAGLVEALEATGDSTRLVETRADLREIWSEADPDFDGPSALRRRAGGG